MSFPDKKIRLLHVLASFKGDYPLFNQVVEDLDPNIYSHIVCYLSGPIPKDEALSIKGYDVRILPFTRKELRKFHYKVVDCLRDIIISEDISLIHTHHHKSTVYSALAIRGLDVRLIASVHGQNRWRSLRRRLLNRFLWRRLAKIIAVSEAVKRDILDAHPWLSPDKIAVIYNGIDVSAARSCHLTKLDARAKFGLPSDKWLWGTVGRLSPVKGHKFLLHAWAKGELGKQGGHLVLAGEGRLKDELKSLARELNIDSEVSFLGYTREIPCLLTALDSFVFPSINEGLGLALLEALSVGLPIVASDTGGIPEVIGELCSQGFAKLVPVGSIDLLSSSMRQVMSWDLLTYDRAREASINRAMFFDKSNMLKSLDLLYRELV